MSTPQRKLILKNSYSAGDIVMLTAAVRDLHRCNPGTFLTDVRTSCADLWLNNPYLTPLSEDDPTVEQIECSYPLINDANRLPYHCLHGFMKFLSRRLRVRIEPTAFHGDIHLSDQEKSWYSQVHELAGCDLPFWIVAAGGKYDIPIKWWSSDRYQAVVDRLRDRIQFVQVGDWRHHHPRLERVIDLRGRTSLRELVRLVYHAQGVLCSVTALMHLAAAVPTKRPGSPPRPCVVLAGGREPVHWEAYPGHRFLHTIGTLTCCASGGCWKDRVAPLGDGRDHTSALCVDPMGDLPRCMHLISPAQVARHVADYFHGGRCAFLRPVELAAAARAVRRSRHNPYDQQPLTLSSVGLACRSFLKALPPRPPDVGDRGIVICAGGVSYFTCAYVCIRMLRWLGCRLPIQVWYRGEEELDPAMLEILRRESVETIDAEALRRSRPARRLGGWGLKAYAILHSRFEEVLLLDADNVPVENPELLFSSPEYLRTGAVFWPDYSRDPKAHILWRSLGVRRPREPEFESGQILVNKKRCWAALCLSLWLNEHSDFIYRHVYGDKETFHLAFCKVSQPYSLVRHPIKTLPYTMCQHGFDGRRLFQHRNRDKWSLLPVNRRIKGFRHEARCRRFLQELQIRWDGRLGILGPVQPASMPTGRGAPRMQAIMISCPQRDAVRRATLQALARTDWAEEPKVIMLSGRDARHPNPRRRITLTARRALEYGLSTGADHILLLEDDLRFNAHLRQNLERWPVLHRGTLALASLYNPGLQAAAWDVEGRAALVPAQAVYGSQAFILGRPFVEYVLRHWQCVHGMHDIRISRLAGRLGTPVYYHAPSLVQHIGRDSVWGGGFHDAEDFRPRWRARNTDSD